MAQADSNPFFDHDAIKSICIKKWMLLAEHISLFNRSKVSEHLRLTKELFGENMWRYFVKKKIRQAVSSAL